MQLQLLASQSHSQHNSKSFDRIRADSSSKYLTPNKVTYPIRVPRAYKQRCEQNVSNPTSFHLGNTVLQPVGGQMSVRAGDNPAALVSVMNQSGAILQGGLVTATSNVGQTLQIQPSTGQKVSIAVTGSQGLVTNVVSGANVQMSSQAMTPQQRAQYIKQLNAKQQQMGRSTITMPVTSEEMLVVKRQMVNSQQAGQSTSQVQHQQSPQQQTQSPQQQAKTQILQQTFTPSIQLQSAGGGQQHIALVKTSTGAMVSVRLRNHLLLINCV